LVDFEEQNKQRVSSHEGTRLQPDRSQSITDSNQQSLDISELGEPEMARPEPYVPNPEVKNIGETEPHKPIEELVKTGPTEHDEPVKEEFRLLGNLSTINYHI
jgi:hypothetical protein